ncbi:MAG: inorganic phosphate transporter [Acholeplasmataceae bacterium]|nr:inorganic phosphate transporter [Acholeplasmataceae bacterium]
MAISFADFIYKISFNYTLLLIVIITLVVIVVNGLTVAPNAIVTCVSTRSLSMHKAIILAAIFNFLGVLVMTYLNSKVVQTIFKMADFGGKENSPLIALCAAMITTITWCFAAWKLGIPTSEGHALIASMSGAAIALQHGFDGINFSEWIKVIYGLFFSIWAGLSAGYIIERITVHLFRNIERSEATSFLIKAQISASAALSFMHGAQDGQKFIAVMLLGIFLVNGVQSSPEFNIPLWVMLLCSCLMAVGTIIGGQKIIKKIGMDMVKFEPYQGFAADMAASACLFIASSFGLPMSTVHTKTTAMLGVGVARRVSYVKWWIVKDLVLTWVLTLPGCCLLGYFVAFILLLIFG